MHFSLHCFATKLLSWWQHLFLFLTFSFHLFVSALGLGDILLFQMPLQFLYPLLIRRHLLLQTVYLLH